MQLRTGGGRSVPLQRHLRRRQVPRRRSVVQGRPLLPRVPHTESGHRGAGACLVFAFIWIFLSGDYLVMPKMYKFVALFVRLLLVNIFL